MIQFLHFSTKDPEGFALINVADISAIRSTVEDNVCLLITKTESYLVVGTFESFKEGFRSLVGSEFDMPPDA